MRYLVIGGDSFTFGSELIGKSWAELLGDKLGYTNKNVSIPGAGNATIARCVLNSLPLENAAVAIMWTFLARFDYYVKNKWETITPHTTGEFSEVFYKHVGNNEIYELHNTLTNILMLQNTLEKYNIPYVFTSADSQWTTLYFANDPWIAKLIQMIDWNKWYSIDNGNGFYNWGKSNYECGEFGHPLDKAHIDLSNDMLIFAKKLIGFTD
jgi:hypothetical protein